jgi:SAM-dependent methyltransferase
VKWRVQAAIDKALGYVPGGLRIHERLHRRAAPDFGNECDVAIDDWLRLVGHGLRLDGATVVELGAGRLPAVALGCHVAGAAHVYALDRERRIDDNLVPDVADRLMVHLAAIARTTGRPEADVTSAQRVVATSLARGASLAVATGSVVDYRAPAAPADTALPAGSIDVVLSASVLEHVPDVSAVFAEAMRILRPGGTMAHAVDCADHYAPHDPLNYLRFSDAQWARWNNDLVHQNRLRAKDFADAARAAGFTVELVAPQRSGTAKGVHTKFIGYAPDELAITSFDLLARK